jgi:hypothetical protein
MDESARMRRLVAVGVLGALAFSYPLIALLDSEASVLGVPVLWAYLLLAWLGLIALAAAVVGRSR